jgi:hypothetical protein
MVQAFSRRGPRRGLDMSWCKRLRVSGQSVTNPVRLTSGGKPATILRTLPRTATVAGDLKFRILHREARPCRLILEATPPPL